jgi:hypothetical protein
VIVAVILMDVMAMTFDDVVDVVAVLHRLVPTFRAVDVLGIVTLTDVVAVGEAHVSLYGPG